MPALDPLTALPSDWKVEYEQALPAARVLALRLPLVRVMVSHDPSRRTEEIQDVFCDGTLKPSHKSALSRSIEHRLDVPDYLYFHLGRTHPDYGDAVLVLSDLHAKTEASPFGLGGLLCDGSEDRHADGSCVAPVSHQTTDDQRIFVRDSTWISSWRERAGEFLGLYFGAALDRYFLLGEASRPLRSDPDGIYADRSNQDWRTWTIEVRTLTEISLFESLTQGQLVLWAMIPEIENDFYLEVADVGISIADLYPFYAALPVHIRVESAPTNGKSIFELVDEAVRQAGLT